MYGVIFLQPVCGAMAGKIVNKQSLFGTDGIRCIFGEFPLKRSLLPSIGMGIGQWVKEMYPDSSFLVMGRDTRQSGHEICRALCQGLNAVGIQIGDGGILSTPAVSFMARNHRCVGIMISASHNPASYNGIKFFNPLGEKLSDAEEQSLSHALHNALSTPSKMSMDRAEKHANYLLSSAKYEDFLCQTVGHIGPIRVVVDAAHGSLYAIALRVLKRCGVSVVACQGMAPNGHNINDQCGSLYPEKVKHIVRDMGADLGLSFDGDGDRLIIVDRYGNVQDGDQILAFLSTQKDAGQGVVGTVMSNMALESFVHRIKGPGSFIRSCVGDRWIAACLRQKKWHLGGEACGHILHTDLLPTGDGLLMGMMVAKAVSERRCVFPVFQPVPSVVRSLDLHKMEVFQSAVVQDWILHYETVLAQKGGRFLARLSGTESKIRLLIEAPDQRLVTETMHHAVSAFRAFQSDKVS